MYEEHMKVGIDKVVVMMVAEDGEVNIFEKKTADYLDKLQTIMNEWYDNFVYKVGIA